MSCGPGPILPLLVEREQDEDNLSTLHVYVYLINDICNWLWGVSLAT